MKKRFTAVGLALLMVIGTTIIPNEKFILNDVQINVSAETKSNGYIGTTSDGFTYIINADDTFDIFGYSGKSEKVVIPSKIDGKDINSIWGITFNENKKIKSVVIPEGITTIGDYTFDRCTNLKSISIPKSVTEIGERAFNRTAWLTAQQKANPLVVVNNILVDGSTAKGDVTIPSNVKSLCKYAFENNNGIKSITLSNNITNIPLGCFQKCSLLEKVNFNDNLKEIGQSSFEQCTKLKSIKIPKKVTYVSWQAFNDCTSLKSVTFLGTAFETMISFENTPWFKNKREKNPLVIVNNVLIDGRTASGDVVVPNTVKKISSYAFTTNQKMTSIVIPSSVEKIGNSAFINCFELKSATIMNKATEFGIEAFVNTFDLTLNGYENSTAQNFAYENGINFNDLKPISSCTVTLDNISYTYDGKAKKPSVTVKNGNSVLVKDKDYTVKYSDNTEAGTAVVTISGIGKYAGNIKTSFTIKK